MLVRLRPNWDELKVYLLAKGRKRFEAFICTMSERDYALEMWRLLDPDARLINPRELNERVTCVKSGMSFFACLCVKHSFCTYSFYLFIVSFFLLTVPTLLFIVLIFGERGVLGLFGRL